MSVYQSMRGGGHPLPPWIRYCVPGKANLAAYVQGSRRFWQTALISGSRGFRALKGPILGRLAIRRKCSRQSLVLAVIEKIKPPMLSHGGFHMLGCRLDAISADIIGADEADRAETRVELLQAGARHRFFPDLWASRAEMTDRWGSQYGVVRDSISKHDAAE